MDEMKQSLEVAKLLGQVMELLKQNMIKGFENTGITATQGMVIGVITKCGKIKISELSEKLGLSNSTVSGVVDRLEDQGIVIRERCKIDRRVVHVSLSSKFQETYKDFYKITNNNIDEVMNKATSKELDKIHEALNILKKLLID